MATSRVVWNSGPFTARLRSVLQGRAQRAVNIVVGDTQRVSEPCERVEIKIGGPTLIDARLPLGRQLLEVEPYTNLARRHLQRKSATLVAEVRWVLGRTYAARMERADSVEAFGAGKPAHIRLPMSDSNVGCCDDDVKRAT